MNLALFGGSFDPPHAGHVEAWRAILHALPIDRLIITPAFLSPFKSRSLFPASLRLQWVKRLAQGESRLEVSDFEIAQNRSTPTIETILHLKALYHPTRLFLVIGDDHLPSLAQWHRFSELEKLVEFVIITRENHAIPAPFHTIRLHHPARSSLIREGKQPELIPASIRDEVLALMNHYKEILLRKERALEIVAILDSKKGENVELFDLSGSDYLVDYVIIATALVDKHAASLLDALKSELKPKGETFYATEEGDDWIVADLGDIMIHLFTENHRKKFNLEEFLTKLKEESKRAL